MQNTNRSLSMSKDDGYDHFFNGKVRRKLTTIDTGSISTCSYNPEQRNEGAKKLGDTIEEVGGLLNPLHVRSDMTLIDGHGRLAELKRLGFKRCKVYMYEGEAKKLDVIFKILNTTSRMFSGKHQMEVLKCGGPVMGKSSSWAYKKLTEYFKESEISASALPSPSFVREVEAATNIVVSQPRKQDRKHIFRSIYKHAHEHKLSRVLHEWVRRPHTDSEVNRFYRFVLSNKSYA